MGKPDWTCVLKNHSACTVRHKLGMGERGPRRSFKGYLSSQVENGDDLVKSIAMKKKRKWIDSRGIEGSKYSG
jgi:hypothetical protein